MICFMLAGAVSAAVLSDDFSDGDYTNNPAWTVEAGTFDASGGHLQFGTGGGTAITLDFPAAANTAMSVSFKIHQMNGTSASATIR